jgi:hypothetical protein
MAMASLAGCPESDQRDRTSFDHPQHSNLHYLTQLRMLPDPRLNTALILSSVDP